MAETRPVRPHRHPPLRTWRNSLAGVLVAAVLITLTALLADYMMQTVITVSLDEKHYKFRTRADTVQGALDDINLTVDPEDVVSPPLDSRLNDNMTITIHKAYPVALLMADQVQHVRTHATHPLDILAEQGIVLAPDDIVQVNGQNIPADSLNSQIWQTPPPSIRVVHSVTITIKDGTQQSIVHTTQADVGHALDQAGIKLYLADRVVPDLSVPVYDDLVIQITRSVPLTIRADGQQIKTRATGPTVGDALTAIGLAPVGQDYTLPSLDTTIEAGMIIELIRVTEDVVTKDEPIPFSTIYRADENLPLDEKRIIQEGTTGIRTRQIRVRYENGSEVSRTVQEEWVTTPPTPRMIVTGKREKTP